MSDVPYFLLHRDPDHRDEREQRRDQYALRGSEDRRPRHYLTMEDAMEMANELARVVLPEGPEA
jgi:hypothetical protein